MKNVTQKILDNNNKTRYNTPHEPPSSLPRSVHHRIQRRDRRNPIHGRRMGSNAYRSGIRLRLQFRSPTYRIRSPLHCCAGHLPPLRIRRRQLGLRIKRTKHLTNTPGPAKLSQSQSQNFSNKTLDKPTSAWSYHSGWFGVCQVLDASFLGRGSLAWLWDVCQVFWGCFFFFYLGVFVDIWFGVW